MEALAPVLKKSLKDEPILFIKLNLTDEETSKQSAMMMAALGFQEDWDVMEGATGLVNVIDVKTKKRVAQLDVTYSVEKMASIIRENIK